MGYSASFRVWRGDVEGGGLRDYRVEVNEGEVVLDVLHRLQATQTGDLAVRWNCKAGKCGSCSAEVNGRPRLLCMTRMSTYSETETLTVTPLRAFPVIRDLVTDVSFNYEKARQVPAFAPPQDVAPGDYRMAQLDVERSQEFRKCIECWLCQDTCHVIRDHEENKTSFAGPRFLMRVAELDMHPLDTMDRRDQAQEEFGLGYCNITKCCSEVCPEGIHITDNALIPMKERVVDRKYDPLVWLGSRIPRRSAATAARSAGSAGSSGEVDAAAAEQRARARVRERPRDGAALAGLADALAHQGRFAEAASTSRQVLAAPGRATGARLAALQAHAAHLLRGVESNQLRLADQEGEISQTLDQAQHLTQGGTTLSGLHALHALVAGDAAEAQRLAAESLSWHRSSQEQADALLTQSRALTLAGSADAAAAPLTRSRQLWPDNPRLASGPEPEAAPTASPAPTIGAHAVPDVPARH